MPPRAAGGQLPRGPFDRAQHRRPRRQIIKNDAAAAAESPFFLVAIAWVCCTIVTVYLRSGFVLAAAIDRKLMLWLGSLAALTAFNVTLWIWIARSVSLHTPY